MSTQLWAQQKFYTLYLGFFVTFVQVSLQEVTTALGAHSDTSNVVFPAQLLVSCDPEVFCSMHYLETCSMDVKFCINNISFIGDPQYLALVRVKLHGLLMLLMHKNVQVILQVPCFLPVCYVSVNQSIICKQTDIRGHCVRHVLHVHQEQQQYHDCALRDTRQYLYFFAFHLAQLPVGIYCTKKSQPQMNILIYTIMLQL